MDIYPVHVVYYYFARKKKTNIFSQFARGYAAVPASVKVIYKE